MPDRDVTLALPNEVFQGILNALDARSLDCCCLVSRRWRDHCVQAMVSRGPRHIRLQIEIVGAETEDGEREVFWLFKRDTYDVVKGILITLCATYRLWRLSSVERSFHESLENDIGVLLKGDAQALLNMQLRVSGYLDRLNHPERELTNLVMRQANILTAMTEGVLTKIGTRLLPT